MFGWYEVSSGIITLFINKGGVNYRGQIGNNYVCSINIHNLDLFAGWSMVLFRQHVSSVFVFITKVRYKYVYMIILIIIV